MGVQADYRDAAVALLEACATAASIPLQVYRGRPRTLYPPTAFIDGMSDELEPHPGASLLFRHTPLVEIVAVWGLLDSGEAVDQRDAFVDAFHSTVRQAPHQAGGATLIAPRSLGDVPAFVPDWLPEQEQNVYFATRIVLEGLTTD